MKPIMYNERPASEARRCFLEHVHGECLERIGIIDPEFAAVDQNAEVRVGDIVHCTRHAGVLNTFLKQVKEIKEDGTVIVGTAYLDRSRDFEFEAAEILGVVLDIYSTIPHRRIYHRSD